MIRSVHPFAVVAILAALAPSTAFAQADSDKATARELGRSAQALLDGNDFKGAEDEFRRADALYHAPTLMVGLARAQAKQGKFVEAWESYNRVVRENNTSSTAFASAVAEAQAEIVTVEKRRARVTLTVTGSDSPTVTVDDVALKVEALGIPRYMNPGPHVFKATGQGKMATQSLTIPEGADQSVTLTLAAAAPATAAVVAVGPGPGPEVDAFGPPPKEPSTASPSSWQRTGGFVGMGVGGAFLIEGVITGILVVSKHGTLTKECSGGVCPPSASSDLSSYNTMGALSTIGFIAGPVLAGAGVVLFLTAPKGVAPAAPATGLRVTPYVGFGSAGATGTF
jgi:hypothetical protein